MSKYPRIVRVDPKPRSQGVVCKACGEPARFKSHVEVSWFRGEDEVVWSCAAHNRDARALLVEPNEAQS